MTRPRRDEAAKGRRPAGPGRGGRDAGARGGSRSGGARGAPGAPTPSRPRPFRVTRWGKFWALEPLFADTRTYLVAKGGPPPRQDEVVLAEPSHGDRLRIVRTLGPGDDLQTVLRAMLHARDVRQGFGEDVLEEAAAVAARAARRDPGRRDVTKLPTFTIDPDTARDFDDALSVAREDAGYRVHVHIADVSYFVDPDGAIEAEARRRTASLYMPLFAEPMLPARLSSDVCSLVPREPRKCLTVEAAFDAEGRRTSVQFYRSLISSDHRLTYGFVDGIIGEGDGGAAAAQGADRPPEPAVSGGCARRHGAGRRRARGPASPGARARRRAAPPPQGARRPHAGLVRARIRASTTPASSWAP